MVDDTGRRPLRAVKGPIPLTALRWGFKTSPQHTTWDAIRDVWLEADRVPDGLSMVAILRY